jgi:hypothetical protein
LATPLTTLFFTVLVNRYVMGGFTSSIELRPGALGRHRRTLHPTTAYPVGIGDISIGFDGNLFGIGTSPIRIYDESRVADDLRAHTNRRWASPTRSEHQ